MANFCNFGKDMELVDLPCVGGKFTCFSGNDLAMSKLDRFPLTDNLVSDWKLVNQFLGKRVLSDHCPVWLKGGDVDWGPKPFKFNNGWFKHDDFYSFVNIEWSLMLAKGIGDFNLYEKLKSLKTRLKVWNKDV